MRVLDARRIPYESYSYVGTGALNGGEVAAALNQNPAQVFKTLVTVARSGNHYVFMVPVCAELDLKRAATAVGEKSIDMLKSFHKYGGKRVVMAGTYAEYGYHNETLKETMPAEPINIYSQCKDFVHKIAEVYCYNNNVSFGWGRIFSAFGKEKDPRRLTSDVINHLSANQEVVIRSGSLIRDYIYTKDIAAAFVKFLDSNVEGVVNICTGKDTSIHDYVMKIAQAMGKENLVVFNEQASSQQVRVVGDSTRLNKEVGFVPQYSIEEAITEILL